MNKTLTTRTLPGFLNERGIGFDRMFDMLDEAVSYAGNQTYPPYNVLSTSEDDYVIEVAVAGFGMDNLKITQDANKLHIDGSRPDFAEDDTEPKYLHRGISSRAFTREFVLAEHVIVEDAALENGILSVKLHRELPDAIKPRTIDIKKAGK
jgi:molecular chaperone IbpA